MRPALVLTILSVILLLASTTVPAATADRAASAPPVAPRAAGGAIGAPPVRASPLQPGGEWSTYLHDVERSGANLEERTLSPSNVSQLSVVWKIKTNGSDFGSPTVVNGTVYAGSWDGNEYALNASTGRILWKTNLGIDTYCTWGSPMGVAGNAAVWNGSVYVGGGGDYWYALNAANGSIEWKVRVGDHTSGNYNWASPLLVNGYEYIGVASCIDSPLVQGKLLMVNLSGNHSIVHTFDFVPNGQSGATVWTTPSYDPATGTIWVATGNDDGTAQALAESIVGLTASNLTLRGSWQVPGVVGKDSDFGAGPTLFNDSHGHLFVGATDKNGFFYALNRSNVTTNGSWTPDWAEWTWGAYSPAAFANGQLFLGGGQLLTPPYLPGSVWSVDPLNGTPKWETEVNGVVYGALAYANGLIIAPAGAYLYVLNATNGAILEQLSLPSTPTTQTIEGAPSVEQGRIFYESGDYSTHGLFLAAGIPLAVNWSFNATNATAGVSTPFVAVPSGGMPPYNFTWSFGDGSTAYGRAAAHTYATGSRSYNVTLVVTDAGNDSQTLTATLPVLPALAAWIAATGLAGSAPYNVTFSGSAEYGSGPPYTYSWSFGDGSPNGTGAVVRHEFVAPGTFVIVLTVNDSDHVPVTRSVTVSVIAPFTAAFTASPTFGDAPLTVTFHATAASGTPPYVFDWSSGYLGATATGPTATFEYPTVGNFTARLNAYDSAGAFRSALQTIEVAAGPAPLTSTFTILNQTGTCPPGEWNVSVAASADGGVGPYAYAWSFGDGTAGQAGANVTHWYSSAGVHAIGLAVTDSGQRVSNLTQTVDLVPAQCPSPSPVPSPPSHPAAASNGLSAWELEGAAVAAIVLVGVAVVVGLRRRPRRARPRVPGRAR